MEPFPGQAARDVRYFEESGVMEAVDKMLAQEVVVDKMPQRMLTLQSYHSSCFDHFRGVNTQAE